MELSRHRRYSLLNFIITSVFLAAILAGLGVLTVLELNAANSTTDPAHKKNFLRMVWLTISLGGLILILLVWMAIRQIKYRFSIAMDRPEKTEYQDAWTLAGRRLKVEDGEDQPDQPGCDVAGDKPAGPEDGNGSDDGQK